MKRPATKRNRWDDHYTVRARKEKYPARSVFKLQEMQRKFRLLKKGIGLSILVVRPVHGCCMLRR